MRLFLIALAAAFILPVSAQKVKVDVDKSSLTWTGKKVTGSHYGSIMLKSGWLKVESNKLVGGEFVVDMTTIIDEDLSGEMKAKLEGHLKSDDFFGVEKHPESTLKVNSSEAINSSGFKVKGDLTIKGITHPISFDAKKMGSKYVATIVVDRSKYDVKYGSETFFGNLGDKAIYDDFTIEVVLSTK